MSSVEWYYVRGNERVGPVNFPDMKTLWNKGELTTQTYVWCEGMENWQVLEKTTLPHSFAEGEKVKAASPPQMQMTSSRRADSLQERVYTIKIGMDRGGEETEYGPYSIDMLIKLYEQKRINEKTLVFAPGFDSWQFLGESKLLSKMGIDLPPVITDNQRRKSIRRPFIARIFFHDDKQVYEGVCRDISTGGLQILVADLEMKVGETVHLNVHPDNSEHSFVASGRVVRLLEGNQGLSIRFADLGPEAKSAIQGYIDQMSGA
jgi:hypothetical protein